MTSEVLLSSLKRVTILEATYKRETEEYHMIVGRYIGVGALGLGGAQSISAPTPVSAPVTSGQTRAKHSVHQRIRVSFSLSLFPSLSLSIYLSISLSLSLYLSISLFLSLPVSFSLSLSPC